MAIHIKMKYTGKVYGKVAGRYIELTQTIEDLESEIARLKDAILILNKKT